LPQDLAWLTGQGLSRAGIFKLMGKAKAKGKRLSDIVTVVAEYLPNLKGGRLYAYLAKLADGTSDFSVAAASARRLQAEKYEAARLQQQARIFRERFGGATLTNRNGTRLYLIDAKARFVQVLSRGAAPSSGPLTEVEPWIERLRSGDLVPATADVERRYGPVIPDWHTA
jgi:hypothetical protein